MSAGVLFVPWIVRNKAVNAAAAFVELDRPTGHASCEPRSLGVGGSRRKSARRGGGGRRFEAEHAAMQATQRPRVLLDLSADELGHVLKFLPDAEAVARTEEFAARLLGEPRCRRARCRGARAAAAAEAR